VERRGSTLTAALLLFVTWRAAAQGTVNFANGAAGVNAPVILSGAASPPEAFRWQAELLLVGADGRTKRVGEPALLQGDALAGYFFGGSVSVTGVGAGAEATFRIRAFDTLGTGEAISNPIKVMLGGGKMPPPNLVGLQSWGPNIPTPYLKIAIAPSSVTLSWSKEFPNAALEFADSLANPNWNQTLESPRTEGDRFVITMPATDSERYFRLRLN
jgi:hypothetical protein